MSDDWKPGDLALCVDDKDYDGEQMEVRHGAIYTVADLYDGYDEERDHVLVLILREVRPVDPEASGFEATCFRKINPLTPDERHEFLTDLYFDLEVVDLQKAYRG